MKFVFVASLRQPELSYATSRFSGRHTRGAASADAAAFCDNALHRVAALYSQGPLGANYHLIALFLAIAAAAYYLFGIRRPERILGEASDYIRFIVILTS
jgi:hypothetical protein